MNRLLQPRPLVVLGLNVWMGTAAGADELVSEFCAFRSFRSFREVAFAALVLCIKPTLSPPIKESYV